MAKLGNIRLEIEKEGDSSSIDATSHPVEEGIPYSDHVNEKPDEFSLSGSIIGSTYEADYQYLKRAMKTGEILTYVGRNVAKNVIILSIDGDVDYTIANGKNVSFKLQTVRIATTSWVKVKNNGQKKLASSTPNKPKAIYHLVKKGDTYWGCAQSYHSKYGTTVSTLRKLNPWPDRKIPIGAKMRII